MNKKVKYSLIIFWILFLIWQSYSVYIDIYNFRQLESVKIILKDLKRDDKQFFNLKEFNNIYTINIQPIKNCYYLRNYKWEDRVSFTFWFQLESLIFMWVYKTRYYAYPKYDLPVTKVCTGMYNWRCSDASWNNFRYVISHPCEE